MCSQPKPKAKISARSPMRFQYVPHDCDGRERMLPSMKKFQVLFNLVWQLRQANAFKLVVYACLCFIFRKFKMRVSSFVYNIHELILLPLLLLFSSTFFLFFFFIFFFATFVSFGCDPVSFLHNAKYNFPIHFNENVVSCSSRIDHILRVL